MVERLFYTRWSSYFDAVHSLNGGLKNIKSDTEPELNTRRERQKDCQKMENLETVFLTNLWNAILERVNKTSRDHAVRRYEHIVALNLLESLKNYLQEIRDKFIEYELKASRRYLD